MMSQWSLFLPRDSRLKIASQMVSFSKTSQEQEAKLSRWQEWESLHKMFSTLELPLKRYIREQMQPRILILDQTEQF